MRERRARWALALLRGGCSMLVSRSIALLGGALVAVFAANDSAHAAGDCLYQSASGVEAYVVLVPAQITKGHTTTQPQSPLHGGVPQEGDQYHLVAGVFDASTGKRIADARVAARVSGRDIAGPTKVLEPMPIAETMTFGAYFDLPGFDFYTIALTIYRPFTPKPITLNFTCDHGHG